MVVIRLARHGRHKYPTYRIVAADKRRAVTSKFLAILGTYNPHTKEIKLNKEEIQKYLDNGAQASDRVLRILIKEGIDLPKWAKTHDRFKKTKKVEETDESPKETAKEESAVATDEVSQQVAEDASQNAKDLKTDVGTIKETEDLDKQAKTTEKVAEAVDKTVESKKE